MCLTLLSAASRQGVWLPLVLDEPFERLDARAAAALVAVLDVFCRQGHQVLVFTRKQTATERLTSVGAAVHNIASLRRWTSEVVATVAPAPVPLPPTRIVRTPAKPRKTEVQSTDAGGTEIRRRKKKSAVRPIGGDGTAADQSDAA
jgi:hypothetical protein